MTQSAEHKIQIAPPPPKVKVKCSYNFLTLWKILNNLAQIISIMRLCAYDMHGTTSRSWLVKGQKVHINVRSGRGLGCPLDCPVYIDITMMRTFSDTFGLFSDFLNNFIFMRLS
jgi:hypothetical protein